MSLSITQVVKTFRLATGLGPEQLQYAQVIAFFYVQNSYFLLELFSIIMSCIYVAFIFHSLFLTASYTVLVKSFAHFML